MMKCMGAEASARALKESASHRGVGEKVDGAPTNSRSHLTPVSEAVAFLQARQ
jgi:hypothetical protein